ncbi:MAG TPA: TIGR03013 family XrtA/PEP-CTERM system glycosyltransferase [Rhizomicrobium sp.]|nr:TIGR03013 family XrtA/PEP-CTERM system glycosyltransferase [Rhizomicrobium sp.]
MTAGVALFLMDALAVALLWPLTLRLAPPVGGTSYLQAVTFALVQLGMLYALGLYRREGVAELDKAFRRIPLSTALSLAASSFLSAALGWNNSITFCVAAGVCFAGCAVIARIAFAQFRRHSLFRSRLLVIGAGERAWDLLQMLRSQGRSLHYDLTFVHEESFGSIDPRLADDPNSHIILASNNLLKLAERVRAEEIVVAPDDRRGMTLDSLITCRANGYPVSQYMSFLEKEISRIDIKRLDMAWMLYSDGFQISPIGRGLKRLFDILASLMILIPFSPVLLAAMLAVWLGDRGAVFYRQERVTLGGRSFRILKLRTMRSDAEKGGAVWAAAGDSRITGVGKFLRRTRIDELPQLFNVLAGDMSLVGPRPERPEFIEKLSQQLPLYHERHAVKAGLTGWAQVNYPYGASLDDARSKLSYDLYYVKNFNILFDLRIVLQTLRVVMWAGADVR